MRGGADALDARRGMLSRYSALPLFHATAGLLGFWGVVRARCTLVVRAKFSARRFLADCAATRATGCLYVGELARFVVDAADADARRGARLPGGGLRFAFGNGMPRDGAGRR